MRSTFLLYHEEASLRVIKDGKEREEIVPGVDAGSGDSYKTKERYLQKCGGHISAKMSEITLKHLMTANPERPVLKKDQNSFILLEYHHIHGHKLEWTFAPCQDPKKGTLAWWSLLVISANGPKQKHSHNKLWKGLQTFYMIAFVIIDI
ncbi:hypothetical protein PoB_000919700 [Plakobranchus ocellatus]|uniref:Uncharacterized protein n=1 Tax=Plakobranchus ocellatus TaxID=259542 RepID=A0AAV3YJY1_9GAST|nr:hypothetical protein PoB_000919700 [Plakobranchus ocellatus]